jgi:Protein of unknown function (DUF1566)
MRVYSPSLSLQLALTCVAVSSILFACSQRSDEFEGQWKSRNVTMTISRNGDTFVVACRNPGGLLTGNFVGTPTNAGLKVNAGLAGEQIIVHEKNNDTLSFAGEIFSRAQWWVDESGLTWTSHDNGQGVEWNAASAYCPGLQLGGWSDWRLPSIEELRAVHDPSMYADKRPLGWSGTRYELKIGLHMVERGAYRFNFANGHEDMGGDTDMPRSTATVLCVRK